MDEIWKPIPGYPDYEVSSLGNVKSYKRDKPILLKQAKDPHGYKFVGLMAINGTRQTKRVHQLVLLAFIGPCPDDKVVCHNNGIPDDNRLENLRYDTMKANHRDARILNGGVGHGASLALEQAVEVKELIESSNLPLTTIAKQFNVSPGVIGNISRNKNYKYLSTKSRANSGGRLKRANEMRGLYKTGNYTLQQIGDKYGLTVSAVSRIINHQRLSDKEAIWPDRENLPRKRKGKMGGTRKREKSLSATLSEKEKQALKNISALQGLNEAEVVRFLLRQYAQEKNLWPPIICPDCGADEIEILNEVNRRCEKCGLHFC